MMLALIVNAYVCNSCCATTLPHLEQPYTHPPRTLDESDLAGTWEAQYMEWGTDRLVLQADGTFKLIYQDHVEVGYQYETSWNEWWLESFSDGRVRIHLSDARYYLAGVEMAERIEAGRSLYDPVSEQYILVSNELILNVRMTSSGKLILMHMWTDPDREFALIGGGAEEFHRVE